MGGWMKKVIGIWLGTLPFWFSVVGLSAAMAQNSTESSKFLYEQLDEQLTLGMGRRGAPPRAVAKERTKDTQDDERYVPEARGEYLQNMEERFRRNDARLRQERIARNEAWNVEIKDQCGPAGLETAKIGMTVQKFQQCGLQMRVGGGLTHRISLTNHGHSGLLYVFSNGDFHRVYAIDGVLSRITPHPLHVDQVTLPSLGKYPPKISNPQVVALSTGDYFSFGKVYGENWAEPTGESLRERGLLRDRIDPTLPHKKELTTENQNSKGSQPYHVDLSATDPPFMWDAQNQRWIQLEPPSACAGTWRQHTLTALPNDRVLVAGGICEIPMLLNEKVAFEPQSGTALWDSRLRKWQPSPALKQPRIHHTANLVADQNVMLIGGFDDPLTSGIQVGEMPPVLRALESVELFTGDHFITLPSLLRARAKHSATVMPHGDVLVSGGVGSDLKAMKQVELWNATQRRWEPRSPMRTPRYGHETTLLADGRLLVSGGIDDNEVALNSTELYDPTTDAWTDGPPLPTHLQGHTSLLLPDGRVLLAGGLVTPPSLGPWLHSWHPSDKAWRAEGVTTQSLLDRNSEHPALIRMGADKVLAFGENDIYLYRIGTSGLEVPTTTSPSLPRFPDEWWIPPPPAPTVGPAVTSPPQTGRFKRVLDDLWRARSSVGVVAAGLVVLWFLAKWWSVYRITKPSEHSTSHRWIAWLARGLLYGVLAWVAGPHLLAYVGLQSADMEEECGVRPSACLDAGTRLLTRNWSVPGRSKFSSTRIPCSFVGEWVTQVGARKLLISLSADGTYRMPPQSQGIPDESGYWAVQGSYMLWRTSARPSSEIDINRIVANDGQHLELVEADGRHSHYDRQANLPLMRCER
jgi:hypothetical protein